MRNGFIVGLLFWNSLALSVEPCVSSLPHCSEKVPLGEGYLTVYRNFPLTEARSDLSRLVLVVHGILRNANEYYEAVALSAKEKGALERTLILAPHFKNQTDSPEKLDLFWQDDEWKWGGGKMSSFEAIDKLLESLSKNFPLLGEITITGHSAGGQWTSRYAASAPKDYRFIIANPSSYFYPTSFRPVSLPCPEFDEYPYGRINAIP